EYRLMWTSIISFLFYLAWHINNILAKYTSIPFCAIFQFSFLALSSLTPFWSLYILTPSVRSSPITPQPNVAFVNIK
ncbi:hypothetical protein PMAYCL1PPCAC_30872, partial [Pristionchus mayeri]